MLTEYLIFTDNWWNWFVHEYAYTLVILWALLKCLALLDPTNKTNMILDSFRSLLNNGKSLNRRATDKPE
jgi:hypothetical protein